MSKVNIKQVLRIYRDDPAGGEEIVDTYCAKKYQLWLSTDGVILVTTRKCHQKRGDVKRAYAKNMWNNAEDTSV